MNSTPGSRRSARVRTVTNNKVNKRPRTATTTNNKVNKRPRTVTNNKVNKRPRTVINNKRSPKKVFELNLTSSAWLAYRDLAVATVVNRFMYLGPGKDPVFKQEIVEHVISMISGVLQSGLQPNKETIKKVDSVLNSKASQIQKLNILVGFYIKILLQAWKVPNYIKKGGTYYRGVTMNQADLHSVMNGTVKSFTSMSLDPFVAHQFAAKPEFKRQNFITTPMDGFIIKYIVSPDIPVLDLNVNPHMAGVSNLWLKEFILPPGAKLKEGTEKVEMYSPNANRETNYRKPVPVYTVHVTR